ncbi:hypothetical protein B0H66DRAFT_580316 [Apodospora peruviana]|uniref:ABM domain-containing protein n=1 Tax=Apodospora peruviana TaxID=516989 RepID=A0AAE0MBF9_9PEZI|nr:hypothetical protein B0H66DRAFT_580316 [Apodospora peruviana]
MPVHYLAMLYPKPEKLARVEEITQSICEYIKENEPGVLQYQWFKVKDAEKPTIVVWEVYADDAAVETHKTSPKMAWLMKTSQEENNLAEPIKVMPLEEFAGWASLS